LLFVIFLEDEDGKKMGKVSGHKNREGI